MGYQEETRSKMYIENMVRVSKWLLATVIVFYYTICFRPYANNTTHVRCLYMHINPFTANPVKALHFAILV